MPIENEVIKNLEEALKIVDESNLPPAPVSDRPLPIRSERSDPVMSKPAATDKYGIPITPKKSKKPEPPKKSEPEKKASSQKLKIPEPEKKTSSQSEKPSGKTGVIQNITAYNVPHIESLPSFHVDDEQDLDIGSPDFKMKFDFESAYRDVPENRPLRLRREKRTGLVGGLLFATFILCVSLVLASVAWMATTDILGFAADDELVSVQVPTDFTLDIITDMLYEAGVIRYKALFNLYAEYSEAVEKISAGSYILNKNYDYRAIVQGMTARAGVRAETSVTIPEGFTLTQIFTLLEAEGVCPADELWHTATHHDFKFHFLDESSLGNRLRLEGFLFPDTYNFYKDSTPVQAISRMLREFDRRYTEEYIERALYLEYSIHDIITIASLIEREAGNDEERPRIASVIYNRLNNASYPRLEIDATIHYAIAGTGIPFSTHFESEYNTYLYEGLPPGPIASPGIPSIRAALFPSDTNYYYYALNREGSHNFFTNYDDHVNFVNSAEYGG